MMARNSFANFIVNMNPYNSLFIFALGASGTELGMLSSIGLAFSTIFSVLTGWISDRGDKKAFFLLGTAVGVLVPIAYILSPSWSWLAVAFILFGVSEGILQPAWQAMYANSVNDGSRGTVYGLANLFVMSPILFAGLVGGAVVSWFGGMDADGIRPLYYLQIGLSLAIVAFVWRYLTPPRRQGQSVPFSFSQMIADYRDVLSIDGVRSWVLMKSLGSISIGLAGPFWMIYASLVWEASAMTIAFMVTVRTLTRIVLSPVVGRLTDVYGRKKLIIGGRLTMYVAAIIFLWGGGGFLLLLAWVLMGVNDSTGVAWQAKEVELVGRHQRARMTALSVGAFNLLAVPASLLGGYLWDHVGYLAPFIFMIVVDGLVRMPIIAKYVPEAGYDELNSKQVDSGLFTD
ncbi:MFS transporter [Candidatus Bathyarchaeota archaeon]|nr:MFS transporter [Candidatus Bathyarchaeota archaeon]MBL7078803.1 MFS transporter [Candidatus Bathyarchaeota archaeon]